MDFNVAGMLAVVVIFLITHLFLKTVFFRPLVRIMEHREQRVESAREVYERANAQAEEAMAEEKTKLNEARRAAADHREALRKEAQEKRAEILAEVKKDAEAQLEKVRTQLAEQVKAERAALEPRSRSLADEMAERLLGRAV